MKELEMGYQKG